MNPNKSGLVALPKISDERGHLSFIENRLLPFEVKRVYYLYDIPSGSERGGHSHKEQEQLIIAVSGAFSVILDDGSERNTYSLSQPNEGLYVTKNTWRELRDFSEGAVCLVLSSGEYDEGDYIRHYEKFLHHIAKD